MLEHILTPRQSEYQYEPLEQGEIRLLTIQPCPQDQSVPVVCGLSHVSLAGLDTRPYEALSYVWGDPKPRVPINVDKKILLLPVNSEKVLRRVAYPDKPRTIWIDSVCINQFDLKERNQQVAIMRSIYEVATMVLVYIGDSDEYTDRAINNMELLNREIDEDVGNDVEIMVPDVFQQHPTFMGPVRTEIDQTALLSFFDSAWFR
ncbi:hypothetical protein M409DRAFT_25200 [Zasmidium cellare ATCC 36951]|uniref:Heterokaryon incompatibility domain-containing protein n=1 Tax=Zasmidium cellare ATCC 36951 TaxID=1080233 RepID=A0A6A6CBA7_ZASCE|nr:uncharacterized protein M409DRAFT_25200 [Zasmidium cellare ATCC 36951]KAF2164321.1 hypothetical protein M409DRAFT_25200 [Zasmidium cellare ATCC 36951]